MRWLVVLLSIASSACGEVDPAAPAGITSQAELGARHVVVISLDTLRADHLGFLGNEWIQTPRLDGLALESVVFEDHLTVVPTTLASHVTIFTGRYPHHHGTPGNGWMVNPDNQMLPERLRDAGFETAGFAASFALASRFDFAQGFDHYDEEFDVMVGERAADQNHRSAESVTNAVMVYLDERPVPERLFLFVHYFDPHHPYAEAGEFVDSYAQADVPLVVHPAMQKSHLKALELARRYAAEVSYLDWHVGRLIRDLRARGILDDAILVLTTDHGENFIEHGEFFNHGLTVYDAASRSVWLMRLPGARLAGTRVARPTSSVDVLPTLFAELGLEVSGEVDGHQIPLEEPDVSIALMRSRFVQAGRSEKQGRVDAGGWLNRDKPRAIRRGRYEFIHTPATGRDELYDLESDPAEQKNLLRGSGSEFESLASGLRSELDAWASSADPLPSTRERSQAIETRERLKALGYVVE